MLLKIGFAHAQRGVRAALGRVVDHDVRHDALGLNGLAARRVVARRGDLQRRVRAERAHGLHRTLAERLAAHDGGALVVLQRTGNDFAGRGRAFVDQHHHRHGLERRGQALERIGPAPAHVIFRTGLVDRLAFFDLAVGGHHRRAFGQESRRHRHGRIQQAARIVAQIQHDALDVRVFLVRVFDLADEVVHCAFLELAQAHPQVARLHHLDLDGLRADFLTCDGHGERAVLIAAQNRQAHGGARLATHALDGFVQRQALDRRVVHARDQVAGLQACAVGGRAFDGRHHAHQAVFLGDLDADADEAPGRAFTEFLEALLVEVLRMRIQAGNHARNRISDEFLLIHRLNVVRLDHAEHRGQLLQLFQWHGRERASRDGLQRHGGQCAGQGAHGNPTGDLGFLTHGVATLGCERPIYRGRELWVECGAASSVARGAHCAAALCMSGLALAGHRGGRCLSGLRVAQIVVPDGL